MNILTATMTTLMTAAELLAKLRAWRIYSGDFQFNEAEALALLTSWRDEAVRAEREKVLRAAVTAIRANRKAPIPGDRTPFGDRDMRFNTLKGAEAAIRALQEHPSHE